MRKTVLTSGLIAGLIVTAMMIYTTLACYNNNNFEGNMFLGYTAMIVAFSVIFFAVKSIRDKYNNGIISFAKAFKIGLYITLIASTIYVAVWLIEYYFFIPDFMEKYTAFALKQARADGATEAEINSKAAEMASFGKMYDNPLMVILITYLEILPVGLLMSVLSGLFFKRKANVNEVPVYS